MGTSHSRDILSLCDALEGLFKDADPTPDPQRLSAAVVHCRRLRGYGGYVGEKAAKIERLAACFFSNRRHEQCPGGADAIKASITEQLLEGIREEAEKPTGGPGGRLA